MKGEKCNKNVILVNIVIFNYLCYHFKKGLIIKFQNNQKGEE